DSWTVQVSRQIRLGDGSDLVLSWVARPGGRHATVDERPDCCGSTDGAGNGTGMQGRGIRVELASRKAASSWSVRILARSAEPARPAATPARRHAGTGRTEGSIAAGRLVAYIARYGRQTGHCRAARYQASGRLRRSYALIHSAPLPNHPRAT